MSKWYLDFFTMEYAGHFLQDVEKAKKQLKTIDFLVNLSSVSTVMDMGCGTGELARQLASKALKVKGVDIIPAYIDYAASQAEKEKVSDYCDFSVADMGSMPSDETFDLVLNIYSSFGYESTIEGNKNILLSAYNLLSARGSFVMELLDKDAILSNFKDKIEHKFDGVTYTRHSNYVSETRTLEQEWVVNRLVGDSTRYNSSLMLFNGVEVESMLQSVGFKKVKVHHSDGRNVVHAIK